MVVLKDSFQKEILDTYREMELADKVDSEKYKNIPTWGSKDVNLAREKKAMKKRRKIY